MFEVSNNNVNCQSTHLAQVVRLSPSIKTIRHQSFTIVLMKRKWFSVWLFTLEKKYINCQLFQPKKWKVNFCYLNVWNFLFDQWDPKNNVSSENSSNSISKNMEYQDICESSYLQIQCIPHNKNLLMSYRQSQWIRQGRWNRLRKPHI